MESARIEASSHPEYPINVQVWKNGIYTGEGRFCKDIKEAIQYVRCRNILVEKIDNYFVFGLEEDDWDVFPVPQCKHGRLVELKQEAYNDIYIYEDGYVYRNYIGD